MVRLCRLLELYEAITAALIRVGAPVWQDCFIFIRDVVSDGGESLASVALTNNASRPCVSLFRFLLLRNLSVLLNLRLN